MAEGLAGHEGGAVLRAVAREHSPPMRASGGCEQPGKAVWRSRAAMDGLEVEEEEKSCGTHHVHASHAGMVVCVFV